MRLGIARVDVFFLVEQVVHTYLESAFSVAVAGRSIGKEGMLPGLVVQFVSVVFSGEVQFKAPLLETQAELLVDMKEWVEPLTAADLRASVVQCGTVLCLQPFGTSCCATSRGK